jgi:hypothetical protein
MSRTLMQIVGASIPEPPPIAPGIEGDDIEIMGRGRLLSIHDVEALFFGRRGVRWIKKNVAPDKRILIGDLWCWWECDIRDYFDQQRGQPSPKSRAHLLKVSPMRGLINAAVAKRTKERFREQRAAAHLNDHL